MFFKKLMRLTRSQRSHLCKKMLLVIFILISLYLIIDSQKLKNLAKLSNVQQRSNQLSNQEQIKRKQRITKVCNEEMRTSSHLRDANGRFLFYSPLRLSYCVVAKAGCSFWISIVRILLNDFGYNNTKKDPMEVTKLEAHGPRSKMRHLTKSNGADFLLNSTSFLFARNPYTRLFSGYVDKIFLPELWSSLNKHIANLTRKKGSSRLKCVNDITFSEFLQYVVHSEKMNKERNGHWIPIYQTCNPCMWNFQFIGKQESFVKDSVSILSYFGLIYMMKNYSHIQNMEYQTRSQIEYTFYANHFHLAICDTTYSVFAERLWYAFQLQGYIRRSHPVPKIKFGTEVRDNMKRFQQAVVREIHENTMSYTQSSLQKKAMLHEAYAQIPLSVIRQIQQLYDLDFKLFGYDKESYRH